MVIVVMIIKIMIIIVIIYIYILLINRHNNDIIYIYHICISIHMVWVLRVPQWQSRSHGSRRHRAFRRGWTSVQSSRASPIRRAYGDASRNVLWQRCLAVLY